jgi:hypothetical protein
MRVQESISNRLYETISGALDKPVVNIQKIRSLTKEKNTFSVVFASTTNNKNFGFKDYDLAVSAITENFFNIVEGSLYNVESNASQPLFRAILIANTNNIPYTETDIAEHGLTLVRANVFQDGNENMWRGVGEGKNKRLVQVSSEDFEAILNARKQRNPITAAYSPLHCEDGDYVQYFNPTTAALDFGFLVHNSDGDYVFSRSNADKLCPIEIDQIVEAAMLKNVGDNETLPPHEWANIQKVQSSFSKAALLDYMRGLFANTAFFTALEKAIRQSSVR